MVKDHVLWPTKHVLLDSLRRLQTAATERDSKAQATDFGSGSVLIWMELYSLAVYSLGRVRENLCVCVICACLHVSVNVAVIR